MRMGADVLSYYKNEYRRYEGMRKTNEKVDGIKSTMRIAGVSEQDEGTKHYRNSSDKYVSNNMILSNNSANPNFPHVLGSLFIRNY